MRKLFCWFAIVLLLITSLPQLGFAEKTKMEDASFSVFPGVSWGDEIEHVKTIIGHPKERTLTDVVTYLDFETSFETETATTQMFFTQNRLSKILFLFMLPHEGFKEDLYAALESEFGRRTLNLEEPDVVNWMLKDGTVVELSSNRNAVTLIFDHMDE